MKLFSVKSGQLWADTALEGELVPEPNDFAKAAVAQNQEILTQLITDVLTCEHLIILSGLGTSLSMQPDLPLGPTMKQLWDAAKEIAGDKFQAILKKVNYDPEALGLENIELLLSLCQLSEKLSSDPKIAKFILDTEKTIVDRCRFVKGTTLLPVHEAFLRKVARRSTRQPRVQLFTTNYDTCFESAAGSIRFVVVDGFSHSQPQEFDGGYFDYDIVTREPQAQTPEYINNVFQLFKLHGSVDWKLESESGRVVKDAIAPKPLIIYPRMSKFESSYDQPFLEMMSRFQFALRQPNTGLLVIGFGFNDNHIAQPMLSAIRANVSLKMMVIGPHLKDQPSKAVEQISAYIKAGDWRLSLVNSSFKDFVPVVPDLVSRMEEEEHRARIRNVGRP
jgi:SIR2-like domain